MLRRLRNRLKFILERWLQRGALYQFLTIALLIVLVAITGGLLAWATTRAFDDLPHAILWAFLRLTDPGYLGDDEGMMLRTISTMVTVLGYVLFMGSLIAIITQWLHQTLRRLESGLTPISINDHFLILGWTNRTPVIVRELLHSEGRVRRFLLRRGTRRLRIVILAEEVTPALRTELREQLGPLSAKRQIILRSGSSMRIEHLRRVDFASAAAIILPGADFELGGAAATDTRIIKTLMSLSKYGFMQSRQRPPSVVAEVFDVHMMPIARQAYQGQIDIVASNLFISRLIAQTVRHRGLSYVYSELLSYTRGNEVYIRAFPELTGRTVAGLYEAFPRAVLIGAVRPDGHAYKPFLNPPADFVLQRDDRLVFIARDYDDCVPATPTEHASPARTVEAVDAPGWPTRRRILILGWSHKIAALLPEFGGYANETYEIDVLSVVPVAEREARLSRITLPQNRVRVRQLQGDYTVQADLVDVDPASYHNIVFMSSDWLDSGDEADARTILGYVLLRSLLQTHTEAPEVLVELIDPADARLFQKRPGEVIISPVILSHMLAHTALRPELNSVFTELFGTGGAEIQFHPVSSYDLAGTTCTFRDVQHTASVRGEIALGLRKASEAALLDGGVYLNPEPRSRWTLTDADEVVVLTTSDRHDTRRPKRR